MRVLTVGSMYPPQHLGGYELIWQDTVCELRRHGHRVRVLASDLVLDGRAGAPEQDVDVHRELRRYWDGDRYPELSPLQRLRLERANAATLDRHLAQLRPDAVCWFNMGGLSLSLLERVRRAGIPAVGYVADDWLVDGPRRDGWSRAWAQRPRAARAAGGLTGVPARLDLDRAARWLFISDATRRAARAAGWALPGAEIAHAGVSAAFAPAPRPPWRWRLLYAGRVVADKGVDLAVGALAHLPAGATLTIAGPDGAAHDAAELAALIDRLGVADRVQRRPALGRAALARAYAEADVVLFPSRWAEPWGLVGLEAMAVGTPVVASGTGGSAEYLRDGDNALVVAEPQPAAWAAAVRRLAADAELRARLRVAGLQTAARHPAGMAPAAVARALEDIVGPEVPDIKEEAA
jgi:glycosyltransferase involved in cell wall biosynthesis